MFKRGILYCCLVSMLGCAHSSKQWFAVNNAVIQGVGQETTQYGEEISLLIPHRIIAGENIVVAYRESTSYLTFGTDTGEFKKITLEIPRELFVPGQVIDLPQKNMFFALVNGSSAWPRRACFAQAFSGKFQVLNVTKNSAQLLLDISVVKTGFWPDKCRAEHIQWRGELKFKAIESLTTFEGRAGKHIYEETYK